MKAIKIIIVSLIILAAIISGVVFYALSNLNGFVEGIIEDTGTELTQTAVNVSSVDIQVTEGAGAIYGLSIANPAGYSNNKLFVAESVKLKLGIESLNQPVKVINSVSIGEISLRAEQKNIKDTNIQALLDNINKQTSSSDNTSSDKGEEPRIMIEKLYFADSVIDLQTEKFGGKAIKLPGFTLTNIGNKEQGLTPEQAGQTIAKQLMAKVKAAVKKELSGLIKDEAKEQLKDKLKEKLQENISTDKLKSLFK